MMIEIAVGGVAGLLVAAAGMFTMTAILNWWLEFTTGYQWWAAPAWMAALPFAAAGYVGSIALAGMAFFYVSGISQ